ncbi:zinc ribbon domain-containing protein [uncultured Prevotella sp.]|uniref:zinc ribbon domain-containing protein n=1 Tax=uncultured Prevotella sp. TaxID=159272 RepID=UPI002631EC06|nr:zinc ribbon domain-containing protein [uncultured Prevotella sp.]
MSKRYCKECGNEIPKDAKFCPNCGAPIEDTEETQEADMEQYYDSSSKKRKSLIVMLVFLGTLILIVLGVIIYAEYRDAKAEQIAHDKYVRDSIATAHKDSILLAQQKDQMRRDSIKFVRELPKRIKEAYINKVEAYYNQSGNFENGYFLYDLTKDGIPELWVITGNGTSDGRLIVFTYFNENIISIFENNLGYSYFYRGKGYILQVIEETYGSTWYKIKYNGQGIEKEQVYEEEAYYEYGAQYKTPSLPDVKIYEMSNTSPILNMNIRTQQ